MRRGQLKTEIADMQIILSQASITLEETKTEMLSDEEMHIVEQDLLAISIAAKQAFDDLRK